MSGKVISLGDHPWNQREAARQEYDFAEQHYRQVCERFTASNLHGIERLHAALERREVARERYLQEIGQ